jgi:cell filamentation protein
MEWPPHPVAIRKSSLRNTLSTALRYMVDKYGIGDASDCYPGTDILVNLLHIQNAARLEAAERDITALAASTIEFSPPPYDLNYLCAIHKTLFEDIYAWAGKIRTLDISKGATRFCTVDRILPEANKLFLAFSKRDYFEESTRTDLINNLAEFYGDVNMLHPFREGNGRAQRILFEHIVANAGYEISWDLTSELEWVRANIASVGCDYTLLETIFEKCIGDAIKE